MSQTVEHIQLDFISVTRLSELLSERLFTYQMLEFRPKLFVRAVKLCQDRSQAEDLVQTTLAKAWKARASFQLGTNLEAWLYTILRNEFISTKRNKTAKLTTVSTELTDSNSAASTSNPLTSLMASEAIIAMSRLTPDFRELAFLILLDGWSYEAVAARLSISVGTVKSRLWRARAQLQAKLSDKLPNEQVG